MGEPGLGHRIFLGTTLHLFLPLLLSLSPANTKYGKGKAKDNKCNAQENTRPGQDNYILTNHYFQPEGDSKYMGVAKESPISGWK